MKSQGGDVIQDLSFALTAVPSALEVRELYTDVPVLDVPHKVVSVRVGYTAAAFIPITPHDRSRRRKSWCWGAWYFHVPGCVCVVFHMEP